jgi:hypothetical protein
LGISHNEYRDPLNRELVLILGEIGITAHLIS